jgi:hypothetical protein
MGMKIETNEFGRFQLTEVFEPLVLISERNEEFIICMRDSGFEFAYNGVKYSAQEGTLKKMKPTLPVYVDSVNLDDSEPQITRSNDENLKRLFLKL